MSLTEQYALAYAPPRFRSKVEVAIDGCWLWGGSRDRKGYGRWWFRGKQVKAARFAYEHFVGPIPDGLTIDHLCRVTSCVNPGHLEPVPIAENMRRGFSPSSLNRVKTSCPQGHEYTEENTYRSGGKRWCRTCVLARQQRRRDRQRGLVT